MSRLLFVSTLLCATSALAQTVPTTQPAQDARLLGYVSKDKPTPFAPHFPDRTAWEARAAFVRTQALVAQNLLPFPAKTPLQAQVYGKVEKPAFRYSVEKVVFQSLPGHYVTGNLYRPTQVPPGTRLPAVLAPYGHWPNGRFMWTSDADIQKNIAAGAEKSPEGARSPLQAACANLAQMGCIVFQWDLVGYCDGKELPIKHQEGFTDAEAVGRAQSFLGLQSWNAIRALDFIGSLPDVDPARIACTGASSGGTQTIQLSIAEKDRLAAVFPIVMISMNMQGGCVCENAPLLRVGTNNVELATLFAPKPQGAAAANDWTIDFETRGLPEMKSVYALYGQPDNISGKHFAFGHNFNLHSRQLMYDFMNRTLKLGQAEPVTEKPYEPLPPEQLSVWDAEHPRPTDAADAKTIRAYWTKTSGEQLHTLSRAKPAEYQKLLTEAVQAMVVDTAPSAGDVTTDAPVEKGAELWQGTLSRRGAGEAVPAVYQRPPTFNGSVVLLVNSAGTQALQQDHPLRAVVKEQFLSKGTAVLAIDPFMSNAFTPAKAMKAPAARLEYSAYTNGYNRTILANRAHDLLTAIAFARSLPGTRSVRILATKGSAPQAILAAALARDSIDKLAVDLGEWDFDQVTSNDDPNLLPAVLKYGGLMPFVALAASGHTRVLLTNPSPTSDLPESSNLLLPSAPQSNEQLAAWLLQP